MKFEKDECQSLKAEGLDTFDKVGLIASYLEEFLRKNNLHLAEMTGKVFLADNDDIDAYVRLSDVESL